MIDFIEYVVAELKSKRLSKTDAAGLVRQFSLRPSVPGAAAIHPLLQRNTSDLSGQRYGSTFTGDEFFLADHRVQAHKVLPGVAYLEMVRAAIEHALNERPASLELRHTVWAQPIIVSESRQVSIALLAADDDQIDYEIYSQDGEQETIHCQGRAIIGRQAAPARLELEPLRAQMTQGRLDAEGVYAAYAQMGLVYGPSFQALTTILRGNGQVLAQLRLPAGVADKAADYVLHPSLLDGALQSALGLIEGETTEPRLPFALETLRIVAPCSRDMVAWVRYAQGSQATDNVVKLDVDLCDERGNVCVQLHGFSCRALTQERAVQAIVPVRESEATPDALAEKTEEYLRKQLSELLKMPAQKIDPRAALENYGIDSMLAMKLTSQLEKSFGSLPKTLFFEYQTIRDLAGYFTANHAAQLSAMLTPSAAPVAVQAVPAAPAKLVSSRRFSRPRNGGSRTAPDAEPIAIVGLSGRYPEAVDLKAYWENLRDGKDCIVEVPKERWDWREYLSEDRTQANGHHYSKWGGFISGVDEFDPLFFNISPREAELLDPQERLFLQHAWMAIEDAGYTRATLQTPSAQDLAGQVGVYVGVMYNEYQLFGAESSAKGKRMGVPGSMASIANRVSYALNLHGPSMTLDTMCSSSLTAIHLACQDLKQGRTTLAIAGGVNVTIHPNKYLVLSGGQFISSDGHCQSFGEGGDGYIPGEGVGAVLLKRLSDAERDGDHVYGVIRGSALTHGGKTNGYSVPNPQAQTSAISRALAESGTDPRHISYIEAHGTGTKLGDPIEIAALSKAFNTTDTGFCLIGSAKSNIGHCESAAGIAGLTKVLLQMQHQQVVPSLHSAQLNPHIDFDRTPFVVNQTLRPWEQPVVDGRTLPRIAGLSSFGAGGSNAHIIIEEYQQPAPAPQAFREVAIVLSARNAAQLTEKAQDLLDFVRGGNVDLVSVAYTLQTGREAMDERIAFIVTSAGQLAEKLEAYVAGERSIDDFFQGAVKRNDDTLSLFSDSDLQLTIDRWIAGGKLSRMLDVWVRGLELDWNKLYSDSKPRRASLPTYPFARERYWIDMSAGLSVATKNAVASVLHPLLHSNTSDLSEQRYSSTFRGDEFFLNDHRVASHKVLPGVAYLEMARAAIAQALPAAEESVLELHNTVWAQPIFVDEPKRVSIALLANDDDQIDYEIYSEDAEEDVVHCQGSALFSTRSAASVLDLDSLKSQMTQGRLEAESVYATAARMGLAYGPTFQGITAIHRGNGQVLAELRLPNGVSENDYVLHPSVMDSALQAAIGLMQSESSQPPLPFALETLRILSSCTREMFAWVRQAEGSGEQVVKLDIDLCDARGNVCVQLRGLSSRVLAIAPVTATVAAPKAIAAEPSTGRLLAIPVWQSVEGVVANVDFAERHVISCDAGEPYDAFARSTFERVQSILQNKPQGKVLFQIVLEEERQSLFAGISGLLKTAALENPHFIGQILLVPAGIESEELERQLENERRRGVAGRVRYQGNTRQVLQWQEVESEPSAAPVAFKEDGVYLITGGLGSLGALFAREILAQTRTARVVLTGRSESAAAQPDRVTYRALDLTDLEQVTRLVDGIRNDLGRLDGILHSAGMIADRFILKKTSAELTDVLAPKVTGTWNLDQATSGLELDFFVLFSSLSGAMGNLGQADYAAANGFMDQFAAYRNRLVAAGERHGRTRSINWPLWKAGGMGIGPAGQALLEETTGVRPMESATGIDAFYRSLALPYDQLLVAEGDLAKMRHALLGTRPAIVPVETRIDTRAEAAAPVVNVSTDGLLEKTQDYLRQQLSGLLKLPAHRIDAHAALETYGIDSVLVMRLTNELEKTFGSLSKTLFFEYQTIAALAGYFVKAHAATLRTVVGPVEEAAAVAVAAPVAVEKRRPAKRRKNRFGGAKAQQQSEIAIVGVAGRYPQAENLQEFWRNLQNGRDCITEIPADRWDHKQYFDADPNKAGKTYSKWGGFIADVDKFDPLFFNISPKEATLIDPQERLFLETAWQTIEDAGYTRESIAGGRVGVFVGVMWGQYELFGAESILRGETAIPVSSHASIANRVSYFFDFHGPSMALDTMCSSSLTAIHLACEELRKGEIEAAIAGGVNVTIHPYKYLNLSQGKFIASDGRCRSFGAGGDGYVPGEGVGAILLKPLESALRDGDQIYAVIKSTTVNHGGKTNGYTVPNPNAQGELIVDALKKAKIDPKTLSYVETHGTGTSLGDPIEITGLLKAFEGSDAGKQLLPIGSVKSNIGHLESAAGIAAVTKALLQIRNKQLVPSLHATPVNPNIQFEDSPFYVQTELAEWKRPETHPRRVGVSSFGAGGSNAHVILEEYADARVSSHVPQTDAFLISAKNEAALRRYAERIVRFIDGADDLSFADLAYTSQVGRTAMDARLAVLATNVEELKSRLEAWLAGGDPLELDDVFQGNAKSDRNGAGDVIHGKAGKAFLESLLAGRELEKIAMLWTAGVAVDWSTLRRNATPKRVSLPTYPFEKQRYWIKQGTAVLPPVAANPYERTSYVPRWTPKALAARDAASLGTVLLIDESEELFAALKQQHDSVVRVSPLDVQSEEQVRQLAASLRPRAIVAHDVDALYPFFDFYRALAKEQQGLRFVSLHTSPLASAIGGFFKTLTMEDPRALGKSIEIAAGTPVAERAELLSNELAARDWTTEEIRYERGVRSVRTLVADTRNAGNALPLRDKGVYLLTGGFGGLGLIFAEYLAKNFQARLVLVGRSAPNAEQGARLEAYGAEVLCVQGDVAKLDDVERIVREAKARFSEIHGVIHSAGVNRDAFIVRKTREQMEAVLAPKVTGTINLDLATSDENLDLFVLFSSVAGVLGNVGQCDYAFGNRFLDAFAETRAQQRAGRTLSINWPLWAEGGMGIAPADVALLEKRTGLAPLPTEEGIQYWEEFLRSGASQAVALYGVPSRIEAYIAGQPVKVQEKAPAATEALDANALAGRTETYLKTLIGEEIQLAPEHIGSTDALESFGIDSVMINKINAQLERDLGALPKTLLYEHETVRDLAKFLARESREALIALFGVEIPVVEPVIEPVIEAPVATREIVVQQHDDDRDEIAIIGLHGYYPDSADLDEYWTNLRQGRDLTAPVPQQRWDAEGLYDADPAAVADGKIYHKWGGFLADYDKFDPRFFKISPDEAKLIDPQERLFLQSVWAAIEDAGYTRDALRARFGKAGSADVGVFVGVTSNTYSLWAPEEHKRGNFVAPSAMPWSIANRVSYFFDFNGPSMPVDTACSSSLVAVHLACESLRNRDCQVAIAGGVNLYLHPAKYHALCQRRSLSLDGKCHSYGAGDDGFVPGEGVGTLVLKPLRRAEADGDRIYGVIRGSAYDHSGRANGYSAPNPNAQANLISRTLEKARVHPETISYVEGHGTGTQLGDSLEIAALTQAFRKQTEKKQFCPIGSVKANVGHSESAAGITGLAKILLQFEHEQLAPSIHSDDVNPNIDFADSPFYLQHGLSEWASSPDHPRRALINSFGAGGVNACVVVEEYRKPVTIEVPQAGPYLFTLSAKNEERLREYADVLAERLRREPGTDLASLCYTLQTGREAMEERLAIVVNDATELVERLSDWSRHSNLTDIHRGNTGPRRVRRTEKLVKSETRGLVELALRWVAGEEVEWESLYAETPRHIAAPTYPFARERYWVTDDVVAATPAAPAAVAQLHPLISHNASTLREIRFSSSLSDDAFYAVDHKVHDLKVFPGAGFLEMACIAGNIASEQRVRRIRDVVWIQPLAFHHGPQTVRTVLKSIGDSVEYVISSFDEENETVVHSEGRLTFGDATVADDGDDRLTPAELKAQCARSEGSAAFYEKFGEFGLHYGPAFRTVQEIHISENFALAKLQLADSLQRDSGQYILHPSIIDGALQTVAGLVGSVESGTPYLPFALDEIEILKAIPQTCYAYAERAATYTQNFAGVTKFNIRLLSESGDVLVTLNNLYVRPLARPATATPSPVTAVPVDGRLLSQSAENFQ